MGKECAAWVSRRLWGGGNTSPLKTTAWEATAGTHKNGTSRNINFSFHKFGTYSVEMFAN